MARNYITRADIADFAAPHAVKSGDGVVVGDVFAVALCDGEPGQVISFALNHCWQLPKVAAEAWAQGEPVFWDDAAKLATTDSAAGLLIGVAYASTLADTDDGPVRLNGAFGGAGGSIDSTARAQAKAVADRLNEIYPPDGKTVNPGSTVSILTTDAGIVTVDNPTTNPITVPANPTVADLLAAGLVLPTSTSAATDTVSLASLPADTLTAVPTSTVVPTPRDITVLDSSGRDITASIVVVKNGAAFSIQSAVAETNLSIILQA